MNGTLATPGTGEATGAGGWASSRGRGKSHPAGKAAGGCGQPRCSALVEATRFTPTCVGSNGLVSAPAAPLVHPHAPRGDPVKGRRPHLTRVGTLPPGRARGAPRVHPHVRGEEKGRDLADNSSRGSPPRAWGDKLIAEVPDGFQGSPPRAWGRRRERPLRTASCRFTPTCVGKTSVRKLWSIVRGVHPHVRGEDCAAPPMFVRTPGSPPRTWGRPFMNTGF